MDKNTIIGFILIGLVLIGFNVMNQPSKEEIAERVRQDSIAQVEFAKQELLQQQKTAAAATQEQPATTENQEAVLSDKLGAFSPSGKGNDSIITLQNELVELKFATKGGVLVSARLKKYQTHDSLPLYLFDKNEAKLAFFLHTRNNRIVSTEELYFTPSQPNDSTLSLRAMTTDGGYLEFAYQLPANSYMLSYNILGQGIESALAPNANYLEVNWNQKLRQQEKGRTFEERYAQIFYKFAADDVETLSERKDEEKKINGRLKWIGYKDQFFSTVLIAEDDFSDATLKTKVVNDGSIYLKEYNSQVSIAFDPRGKEASSLKYYLGPNHYPTLSKIDQGVDKEKRLQLDELVPLGPSVLRWINKFFTLNIFTFFGKYISNFGIVILLLTLVVKLLISPLTYKSFMSQAKMRVLRPQINEINEKFKGNDKALDRQKATMELYNKVGVSPMSGCVPMLLQMPILFALFMFFPSSIELRQESFLWAKDLSTYDAIVSWNTYIPLITPYFGNHISLFCLLMSITNIIYTKFSMDSTAGQEQIPGMKIMQYMMPLMFLVFFNNYASGLSYYYFISTLFTILQTLAFRYFIDEKKLLAKLHANAKKPKKKSAFMERLERAQKDQEKYRREMMKKKGVN